MANHKRFNIIAILMQFVVVALVLELATADGLSLGYYWTTCPNAEAIVKTTIENLVHANPGLAPDLLRMNFHDCFVRGCDGSVLIESTPDNEAEKSAIPNRSLDGFDAIEAAKSALEDACPGVVSCADVLALAARDAINAINGPYWLVPLGRRDGRVSLASEALANLPPPFFNISQLKERFAEKGLNVFDLVVLSGAHTVGEAHCTSFSTRLYNFTGKGDKDPSLDPRYIEALKAKCPPGDTITTVPNDPPNITQFDAHYYTAVAQNRGLFQSDAALLDDLITSTYVRLQALTRGVTFFRDFGAAMTKMGQIEVLTGDAGEIRKQCSVINPIELVQNF